MSEQQHPNQQTVENLSREAEQSALTRPVSERDIEYLQQRWPFLQLVCPDEQTPFEQINFIPAKQSGWVIHHYGDAMSSSPGGWLFSDRGGKLSFTRPKHSDDGDGDGTQQLSVEEAILLIARGTIHKQSIETAFEMIEQAKKSGWKSVRIIDGHPRMKFAAWVRANDEGLIIYGYHPREAELKKYNRIKRSVEDEQKLTMNVTNQPK